LERWALLARRILDTLDVPIGVTVEQAAERLDVTAPTVRKWLKEGLLRRTEGRKPVEVDPRSLIELRCALATSGSTIPRGSGARLWLPICMIATFRARPGARRLAASSSVGSSSNGERGLWLSTGCY
jgi:hypothetical protein